MAIIKPREVISGTLFFWIAPSARVSGDLLHISDLSIDVDNDPSPDSSCKNLFCCTHSF